MENRGVFSFKKKRKKIGDFPCCEKNKKKVGGSFFFSSLRKEKNASGNAGKVPKIPILYVKGDL